MKKQPGNDVRRNTHKSVTPDVLESRNKKRHERSVFEKIPGVCAQLAEDIEMLGYHTLDQLADADAQWMYDQLRRIRNDRVDINVLYIFRCAMYYAGEDSPDPEKLKWWNWVK